ncbi:SHOCT domain-containing protein [Alkalihalobacterium bogoriense]|uniref:SHOCT domain-containing protein n=1 Tax=Alkalihalobacterium bogoriense TaxID=246272 RepID=UPI000A05C69C|nr:SHOCT domain-containing protein [Alkalihalobacterium bogoriense]
MNKVITLTNEKQKEPGKVFETIIHSVIKIPGVKVDRKEFLYSTLAKYAESTDQLQKAVETTPIEAGFPLHVLDKVAKRINVTRTSQSSAASFVSGIPGVAAMKVTVPADTLQFFGMSLRLAQEQAYLYGFQDLWEGEAANDSKIIGELTIFLGVMYGVGGSAATLRVIAANMSKQLLKKIPQKALTKTVYYPIIKKVAAYIGFKVTKTTYAKGVSKAVPLLGGVVSGGLTFTMMRTMGERLRKTLSDSSSPEYNEQQYEKDMKEIYDETIVVDGEYSEIDEVELEEEMYVSKEQPNSSHIDQLYKLKELLDAGLITREEFDNQKEIILS